MVHFSPNVRGLVRGPVLFAQPPEVRGVPEYQLVASIGGLLPYPPV